MTKSKIQEFYLTAKKLNEIRSESFLYFGHFLCLQIKLLLSREFPPVRLIFLTSNIWSEGKGFFFLPIIHAVNTTLSALVSAGF